MTKLMPIVALLALAACSDDAAIPPAGVSADEERALGEAAEMIEATPPQGPVSPAASGSEQQ